MELPVQHFGAFKGQKWETYKDSKHTLKPLRAPLPLQDTPAPAGTAMAPARGRQQSKENCSSKNLGEAGEEEKLLHEAGPCPLNL